MTSRTPIALACAFAALMFLSLRDGDSATRASIEPLAPGPAENRAWIDLDAVPMSSARGRLTVSMPDGAADHGDARSEDGAHTITGRVVSVHPGVDFATVRVAAEPLITMHGPGFDATKRIADPRAFGYGIATCDAAGRFAIELPSGEDAWCSEYRISAGATGLASIESPPVRARAGDTVSLEIAPIVGVEVVAVDERGAPLPADIHEHYPVWVDLPARRDSHSRVGPVVAALAGLPTPYALDARRCYAFARDLPTPGHRRGTAFLNVPKLPRPMRRTVELTATDEGLQRVELEVPGLNERVARLTIRFPADMVEAVLDGHDVTCMRSMLELRRNRTGFGWSPQFTRGQDTWSTDALVPGEYEVGLFWLATNARTPLMGDPVRDGPRGRQVLTIEPGQNNVEFPDFHWAVVRCGDALTQEQKRSGVVVVKVRGDRGAQAMLREPPHSFVLTWDPLGDSGEDCEFVLQTHVGYYRMSDADGRTTMAVRHRSVIELTGQSFSSGHDPRAHADAVAR